MPLSVRIDGPVLKPVVVCDHCGKEIAAARDGNYQWRVPRDGGDPGRDVFFTHKRCCQSFEAVNRGDFFWGANDLDCLLVYLTNNLAVDMEKAKRKAALLASIG